MLFQRVTCRQLAKRESGFEGCPNYCSSSYSESHSIQRQRRLAFELEQKPQNCLDFGRCCSYTLHAYRECVALTLYSVIPLVPGANKIGWRVWLWPVNLPWSLSGEETAKWFYILENFSRDVPVKYQRPDSLLKQHVGSIQSIHQLSVWLFVAFGCFLV